MKVNPIFTRSFCPWSLFESEDFLDLEHIIAYSHNIRHANSFLCGLFGTNFRKFSFRFRQGPIFFNTLVLRANKGNNSQHCWPNNVGSCCVRVGSGVQTNATTPNNVGTCSASLIFSHLLPPSPQVFIFYWSVP